MKRAETQDAVVWEHGLRMLWFGAGAQDAVVMLRESRGSGCCGVDADTQDAVVEEQRLRMLWCGAETQDAVVWSRDSGCCGVEQRLRMLWCGAKTQGAVVWSRDSGCCCAGAGAQDAVVRE